MWVYTLHFGYGLGLWTFAARVTFACTASDPYPMPGMEHHSWSYAPHCFASMIFVCSVFQTISYAIPTLLGATLEYYHIEILPQLLDMMIGLFLAAAVMKYFVRRDRAARRRVQDDQTREAPGQAQLEEGPRVQDNDQDSWFSFIAVQFNNLIVMVVVIGCELIAALPWYPGFCSFTELTMHHHPDPLAILPIYRSSSTTDWMRIFIACICHPIMHEFVMTIQRLSPPYHGTEERELAMNDPRRHYYPLTKLGGAFLIESTFVMFRRSLLGAMRDPAAVIFAVVFSALEEAIMRSTMVYRDTFFRKLLGRPKMTDAELAMQRKTW